MAMLLIDLTLWNESILWSSGSVIRYHVSNTCWEILGRVTISSRFIGNLKSLGPSWQVSRRWAQPLMLIKWWPRGWLDLTQSSKLTCSEPLLNLLQRKFSFLKYWNGRGELMMTIFLLGFVLSLWNHFLTLY